jgi:hypothetical protein
MLIAPTTTVVHMAAPHVAVVVLVGIVVEVATTVLSAPLLATVAGRAVLLLVAGVRDPHGMEEGTVVQTAVAVVAVGASVITQLLPPPRTARAPAPNPNPNPRHTYLALCPLPEPKLVSLVAAAAPPPLPPRTGAVQVRINSK